MRRCVPRPTLRPRGIRWNANERNEEAWEASKLLGAEFTEESVKKSFKMKAKLYHPDVPGTGSVEAFKKLQDAYSAMMKYIEDESKTKGNESPDLLLSKRPPIRNPTTPKVVKPFYLVYNKDFGCKTRDDPRVWRLVVQVMESNFDGIEFPKHRAPPSPEHSIKVFATWRTELHSYFEIGHSNSRGANGLGVVSMIITHKRVVPHWKALRLFATTNLNTSVELRNLLYDAVQSCLQRVENQLHTLGLPVQGVSEKTEVARDLKPDHVIWPAISSMTFVVLLLLLFGRAKKRIVLTPTSEEAEEEAVDAHE